MALTTWYSAGTVSVDNGSAIVTGTGTLWGNDAIMPGDLFCDPAQPAVPPQRVKEVTADGTLELWAPWPGTTLTDAAYEIRYVGIIERSTAQTRKVLEQLGEVDAYFDVQVDALADRASYDDQPAGYRVLVSNTGDGRSAIYSKNSATSADWSDPAYVTGGSIDVTIGDVTELTFGATPTVQGTPGAGTLELNFGMPGGPALSVGTVTRGDAAATSTSVTGGYELSFVIPSQVAQGDYAGGTAYVTGDVVQDAGSSWVALQATTGNAPPTLPTTSNAYWQLLAQKGNDGAGTVTALSGGTGIEVDSTDPTVPIIAATIASQAEAEAGTESAKLMTPQRTAQAIAELSPEVPSDLYRPSNILGTVSESSGVPTGAIIERGNNANGEYVRFADGTQIVKLDDVVGEGGSGALPNYGGSGGGAGTFQWNYPAAFAAVPTVQGSSAQALSNGGGRIVMIGSVNQGEVTTTFALGYRQLSDSDGSRSNGPVSLLALGRWF